MFEKIEEAVGIAQEFALPPTPESESVPLREELIPALYSARTYIEVGRISEPEARGGIAQALQTAHKLADGNRKYQRLVTRLRVLLEDLELAKREES